MFENFSRSAYIVIVVVLLVIIAMSQQSFFSKYGRSFYYGAFSNGGQYLQKTKDWVFSGIFKNNSGEEVKKGSEATTQNKTNLFGNIFKK